MSRVSVLDVAVTLVALLPVTKLPLSIIVFEVTLPVSVTCCKFELPDADTVAKVNVPAPSVVRNCPLVPSVTSKFVILVGIVGVPVRSE